MGVHYAENAAAEETVASIEADGGSAFAVQADLAEPHAAEALWATFDQQADGADVLVNNAGVVVYGRVNEVVEEDFDRLFAVNVKAVLFIIQHGLQAAIRIRWVLSSSASLSPCQCRHQVRNPPGLCPSGKNALSTIRSTQS